MLGEKDEDVAKEMWHNMAMIGFSIAAGESPNALKNIASGLLEGTKMMREDRATRRAREDKIGMLALEAFDRVWPFRAPPAPLLRALLTRDTQMAARLGADMLSPEDLALCEYVCPARLDYGAALIATQQDLLRGV